MIIITKERFKELKDCKEFLKALKKAGVKNWKGYDNAINIYEDKIFKELFKKDIDIDT